MTVQFASSMLFQDLAQEWLRLPDHPACKSYQRQQIGANAIVSQPRLLDPPASWLPWPRSSLLSWTSWALQPQHHVHSTAVQRNRFSIQPYRQSPLMKGHTVSRTKSSACIDEQEFISTKFGSFSTSPGDDVQAPMSFGTEALIRARPFNLKVAMQLRTVPLVQYVIEYINLKNWYTSAFGHLVNLKRYRED